jgi:hypothetical protein
MELDVAQLMARLQAETKVPALPAGAAIPEAWRAHIYTDLECPSCFCRGAEVVRAGKSKTDGRNVRQASFRFTPNSSSAGHHPFCDFSGNVPAGHIPENLIQFSVAKDGVSRAVRELVCKAIELQVFGQRDVRLMREWFFRKKIESQFVVTLDPKLPQWLESLHRERVWLSRKLPDGLALTKEVMGIPGFAFDTAAKNEITRRYQSILDAVQERQVYLGRTSARVVKFAEGFHGKSVFDPSTLRPQYYHTNDLAKFMCLNFVALKRFLPEHSPLESLKGLESLLALSAVLLFISDWNINIAAGHFARIASHTGTPDETLGNVMGLNPFHDFEAWAALKALQEMPPFDVPAQSVREEIEAWILDAKRLAGLLPNV